MSALPTAAEHLALVASRDRLAETTGKLALNLAKANELVFRLRADSDDQSRVLGLLVSRNNALVSERDALRAALETAADTLFSASLAYDSPALLEYATEARRALASPTNTVPA